MVLHLRVEAPGGWQHAKCRGQVQRLPGDDDIYDPFFPEPGQQDVEQDAIDFCNGTVDGRICPVRDDCLIFALTNNERFGVWGGMPELGRKALRKRWPWRGGREPRPEWHWMTQDEALSLVNPEDLLDTEDDADEPDD